MKNAIFLLILAFLFSKSPVRAAVYFEDSFGGGDLTNNWEFVDGYVTDPSSWYIESSRLVSDVNQGSFSYLYARNTNSLTNYEVRAVVNNVSGVDQQFMFRISQDRKSYYLVGFRYKDQYWPQDGDNIVMYRFDNGQYTQLFDVSPNSEGNSFAMSQNVEHVVKVVLEGVNIKVFYDGVNVINYNDRPSRALLAGGFGLKSWAGDYYRRSVKNYYDNIQIVSVGYTDPAPTPTPPSPTPTTPIRNKIIILPGLGAGWNTEAIINNKIVPDDQWKMNDWVTNYVGLTKALDAKGLVRDRDYFVWVHDWRRPMSEMVPHFNDFLNSKIASGEKVDLVGHSLGGLVARSWAQDHLSDARLRRVMTLGSPHYGAVKAYDVWNGVMISDSYDLSSVALSVLLQLQKSKFGSLSETLRANAPVIHDILPTFDYVKKNGVVVPVGSMAAKSDYLLSKNLTASSVFGQLRAVVATGHKTKEWVNLGERGAFDRVLGLWPEGSPISYAYGDGDGTVLKKSAKFGGDIYDQVTAIHGWMVNASMQDIFDELGLGETMLGGQTAPDYSNYLAYFIGSPANISVNCDRDVHSEDANGFVVFENKNYISCRLNLSGTDNGTYHLVSGKVGDDSSWNYFENSIGVGQTRTIVFEPKTGLVKATSENVGFLWDQVLIEERALKNIYPNNSYLSTMELYILQRKPTLVIDGLFKFRSFSKESDKSTNIIDLMERIVAIENISATKNAAYTAWVSASQQKSIIDLITRINLSKKLTPSIFGSKSYKRLENNLLDSKKMYDLGNYQMAMAKALMVPMLAKQVW